MVYVFVFSSFLFPHLNFFSFLLVSSIHFFLPLFLSILCFFFFFLFWKNTSPCFQVCHYLELRKLMGFPVSSSGKESAYSAGGSGSILGLGRSLGERDRLPTPIFLGFLGSSDRKLRIFMFPWKSNSLLNFLISSQCFSVDTLNFFGSSLEFILLPSYIINCFIAFG